MIYSQVTGNDFVRYTVVILNGKKNPYLTSVARDISSALLKSRGSHGVLAEYRNRTEAEAMLQTVYEKYLRIGGVWTAAAAKVSNCDARYSILADKPV